MGVIGIGQIREDLKEVRMKAPGLTVADVLALPSSLRGFLRWIVLSKAVTCEQVAEFLNEQEKEAGALVDELCARGLIERLPICGMPRFRVCLDPRTIRPPLALVELGQESTSSFGQCRVSGSNGRRSSEVSRKQECRTI